MRTLITGGAGFIGSHLCERFLAEGHEVIAVDNMITGDLANLDGFRDNPRFRFIGHDISNPLKVKDKLDNVLHFASPASPVDYLKHPIPTLKVGALGVPAPVERVRAEFIRVQCGLARSAPGGWRWTDRDDPADAELAKRQKRLLFQHGKKWRRWYPRAVASSPFDRGFLRPYRALRPQAFLERFSPPHVPREPLPPLPPDSPARRFAPGAGGTFCACPLWDVHLFASGWYNDPLADDGQYGEFLAEVARSPLLERVGWLKVSFFGTPVFDFLRAGNFANVETLVLNAGPFPGVLEAVAANESFRSLRYVQFGENRWVWAGSSSRMIQFVSLLPKLDEANARHVPFGQMRGLLRAILRDTPVIVPAVTLSMPIPEPPRRLGAQPNWTPPLAPSEPDAMNVAGRGLLLFGLFVAFLAACASLFPPRSGPTAPAFKFDYNPDAYKIPPAVFEAQKLIPPTKAAPKPPGEPELEELPPGFVGPPRPKPSERKD